MIGKRVFLYGMTLAALAMASGVAVCVEVAARVRAVMAIIVASALEPIEPRFALGMDPVGLAGVNLPGISPALYQANRHEAGVSRLAAQRNT